MAQEITVFLRKSYFLPCSYVDALWSGFVSRVKRGPPYFCRLLRSARDPHTSHTQHTVSSPASGTQRQRGDCVQHILPADFRNKLHRHTEKPIEWYSEFVTLHRQLVSSADRLGAGRFVKVDRIPSSTQLPIFCVTSIMLEAVECVFSECISIPKSYLGVLESKS